MDNRRYCKIVDNEIVEYNRKRSDFGVGEKSSEETCNAKGYYLIVGSEPSYSRGTHALGQVTYSFDGIQVNKNYEIIEISLQELKDKKCAEIDANTRKSILEIASMEKQQNYHARHSFLRDEQKDRELTFEELQEIALIKDGWIAIEMLRNEGNNKEARIMDDSVDTLDKFNSLCEELGV